MNERNITISILEDDNKYLALLKEKLTDPAIKKVNIFSSHEELLNSHLKSVNIIIIDSDVKSIKNDPISYEENLAHLKELAEHSKIIVISSITDAQHIINVFKIGIVDYILKNEETPAILEGCIAQLIAFCQLKKDFDIAKSFKKDATKKLLITISIIIILILCIILVNVFYK